MYIFAKNKLLISIVALVFLGALGAGALAQAGPLTGAQNNLNTAIGGTGLSDNLKASVGTVVKGVLALVGTIFFVLTIYAGILWMTAQGNSETVEKATSIVKASIIGLAITMSAYAITVFVTGKLNP